MKNLDLSNCYLLEVGDKFTFFREESAQEFKVIHIGDYNDEGYAKAKLEVLSTGEETETDLYRLGTVYTFK